MAERRMKLKGLMVDPATNMPIVILRAEDDMKALPIWIGIFEANAIAIEIEGVETPRPMTHDLFVNALKGLNAKITKILICDLQDNTYFAKVFIENGSETVTIDSRPSDAIAIALRCKAPIYAEESVLAKAQDIDIEKDFKKSKRIKQWLEEVNEEDLGEYKM